MRQPLPTEQELIDELMSARDPRRLAWLSRQLGAIGSDAALDALLERSQHRDQTVAVAAIDAIGAIGTDAATALLLDLESAGPARQRSSTLRALASTLRPEARARLLAIAKTPVDPDQQLALRELSVFSDDEVIHALGTIARTADQSTARSALWTLGEMANDRARAILLGFVTGPDSRLAALAIEELSPEMTSAELRGPMRTALHTADATVAVAAASWLGRTGDPDVLPDLADAAVRAAEPVRRAAIQAIGEIGGDEGTARLATLLAIGDATSIEDAADALLVTGDDGSRALVLAAARRGGPHRTSLLRALRGVRGDDVELLMIDIARTGSAQERQAALESLAESGSDRGFDVVLAAAKAGLDGALPVRLLVDGPSGRARAALAELARTGTGEVKLEALEALGQIGLDDATRGELVATLTHGDSAARRSAARTLARAGSPEARRALRDAVSDGVPGASAAAIDVLLEVDDSRDAHLALLAAARRAPLRTQIIDVLVGRGVPEGIALAQETLTSKDARVAEAAATALGRSGAPSASSALREAASSSDANTRRVVAAALAERNDPGSRAMLVSLSQDGTQDVRHAAYAGLGQLGSRDAVERLTNVASGDNAADKVAAIDALGNLDGGLGHAALADVLAYERDPEVVMAAIHEARDGGTILDEALRGVAANPQAARELRVTAAERLDDHGLLDDSLRPLLAPAEQAEGDVADEAATD